jgi:hypothetical protein
MSRMVPALKTSSCSPIARAACPTSLNVDSFDLHIARIDEHRNTGGPRHHLTQEFEPLRRQLRRKKIDPRQVAAGASETGNQTEANRILADDEDDGNVVVAALAANAAVAITATRRLTNSATSAGIDCRPSGTQWSHSRLR